ncbi:ABC transporter permease [Acetobacterium bakii]|uniref:Permease n=1 Tax=Acetobacterium bakii TaxID=52689 RepID=A0A0L6TW74_9FIRM|nr:ABC transporter permease [Acetobacterium bakii]KNZ40516.1 permease [Acetobacterium bakii]
MRLAFSIALRFLKSSKGQTALIVLGIAIGVSVQIFIGSLITGLQKSLVDKTVGSASQITVESVTEGDYIQDSADKMVAIQKSNPDEIINLMAVAQGPAILKTPDDSTTIILRGFDWEDAEGIYKIKERLTTGNLGNNRNDIIVGQDLAEKLNVAVGDTIEMITPTGMKDNFLVTGIFDLQIKSLNESWILTNLNTAQTFLETNEGVSRIEMQVNDVFGADLVALDVERALNDETLTVTNWKIENAALLSGLSGQTASSLMIQVFVMISVVLGIASVLAISVVQKSRQIGILKAMGMHNQRASLVFLFQGVLLGILGAIAGVGLGVGLSWSFATFVVNADGTSVVPLYIDWYFIGISAGIAILASTLASLIPAIRVSKLDPMEVIKNG